ncbi:MAG: acetate--CoA ligase, partial [Pyrinomonadaceae bacterium]
GFRRGHEIKLKPVVDDAIGRCPTVESVVVYKRTGSDIAMKEGRDHWWQEIIGTVDAECSAAELDSEHPLYILYTSGTTGKPKGILHTTGGYLTQAAYTTKMVFDLKDEDIYWCTADIGWVTGHSYVVYGPLANGATVFMYEGAPNFPDFNRFWDMIERHRINILYTAPTAIRAFIKWGEQHSNKHDLSSLRLLGTVGEPINPEAWIWYHNVIGKGKCPIVDTWWQTETGAIMISPLPGATPTVPGTATRPLPGIILDVVTKSGESAAENEGGYLVAKHPWPSMLRTIWGDDERYKKTYWSEIPGCYFAGDGARRDERGYFWIMGRVDDVINVSGHRLGTAEIESALVSHASVAEAAVVGRPDELKGSAISAFVTLEGSRTGTDELKEELRTHVAKEIGALAKPDDIRFTDALPKTRSGKIMRRLLRELATSGNVAGDVTTLEDLSVLEKLREDEE